jgi:uncharacterized protein (DUF1330 family)
MAGYVIAEVEVHDPQIYDKYRAQVPATLAKYGGKFLVRGGPTQTMEGGWNAKRIVVLEFASAEAARRWYESPEYTEIVKLRHQASTGKMIIVEGAPPA